MNAKDLNKLANMLNMPFNFYPHPTESMIALKGDCYNSKEMIKSNGGKWNSKMKMWVFEGFKSANSFIIELSSKYKSLNGEESRLLENLKQA